METILILSGMVACVIIIIKAFENYSMLKKSYWDSKIRVYVPNYESEIVKNIDFFFMKNDGDNPCEPIDDIQPISYFDDCNYFL